MKFNAPRMVLLALFAFAAVGSASATQINPKAPALAQQLTAVEPATQSAGNPWSSLADIADQQSAPLLAHDDRYWHDDRWHDRRNEWRRDNWRRDQWRREQARREAKRHRDWERHHERVMRHRYEEHHRYYRR